jgi:drug/metabolite transporter (DMT)-like permease
VAAFCAGYIMLVGRLRGRISTATVMGISDIATCLALLPIALASGESLTAHTLHGWAVLFALAWLSQVAGQSVIAWSLAHLPAAFGAVTLLINRVAAALFAWATLGAIEWTHLILGHVSTPNGIVKGLAGFVLESKPHDFSQLSDRELAPIEISSLDRGRGGGEPLPSRARNPV